MRLRRELWCAGAILLVGFAAGWLEGARMVTTPHAAEDSSAIGKIPPPPRLFLEIAGRNATVFALLLTGLITAGVSAALVLALNGVALGLLVGSALSAGRDAYVLATLLVPHGLIEMAALGVAGAVGLRGWPVARRALHTGGPGLPRELATLRGPMLFGFIALLLAAVIESTVTRGFLLDALLAG